jgi:hypothetical protein
LSLNIILKSANNGTLFNNTSTTFAQNKRITFSAALYNNMTIFSDKNKDNFLNEDLGQGIWDFLIHNWAGIWQNMIHN